MRNKLETFTDFANSLYPHEADFLIARQQFLKTENLKILNQVHYNSNNPLNLIPYNTSVNKRTYSYLKSWMNDLLQKSDVDLFYDWMIKIERAVMNDSIAHSDEEDLLQMLSAISSTHYYFIRFYQVLEHYHDYLMVRNRVRSYTRISDYLIEYKDSYIRSIELNKDLKSAAELVVSRRADSETEFERLESLFHKIYYDDTLDGYSRYRAVVRLTLLYYSNREFDKLRMVYDDLDGAFKGDLFYSKRILSNYYANRAMMHSKLNELELAEKYGYLSIRQKNSDYLFYLVNLCAILLKRSKEKDALTLMNQAIPELKKTSSFYNKIGFVAFYVKTLLSNNQVEKAVSYATTYFDAYKKEIFEHRWHLFLSSYIQALLRLEKYSKINNLSRRYKLVAKEKEYMGKAVYLPVILWYSAVSEYIEGEISLAKLKDIILSSARSLLDSKYKKGKIKELLNDLGYNIPVVIKEIREELSL